MHARSTAAATAITAVVAMVVMALATMAMVRTAMPPKNVRRVATAAARHQVVAIAMAAAPMEAHVAALPLVIRNASTTTHQ